MNYEQLSLDHEPQEGREPPGYSTDLHAVELTRKEVDIAVLGIARELGFMDAIEAIDGYGYTLRDQEAAASTLEKYLTISESFR